MASKTGPNKKLVNCRQTFIRSVLVVMVIVVIKMVIVVIKMVIVVIKMVIVVVVFFDERMRLSFDVECV